MSGTAASLTAAAATGSAAAAAPSAPAVAAAAATDASAAAATAPTRLAQMLAHNEHFVRTDFRPLPAAPRKIVVVTCMDPRLTTLLPKALNLAEGEAYYVKNAGAIITHPFGGITRSVFIAIYELGATEVYVVGHRDCGMSKVTPSSIVPKMINQFGISRQSLLTLQYSGTDVATWMAGFESVDDGVLFSVDILRNHPLCPLSIPVHGLVIDPHTGKLDLIVDGYTELPVRNGGVPRGHSEWLSSMPGSSGSGSGSGSGGGISGGGGGGGGGGGSGSASNTAPSSPHLGGNSERGGVEAARKAWLEACADHGRGAREGEEGEGGACSGEGSGEGGRRRRAGSSSADAQLLRLPPAALPAGSSSSDSHHTMTLGRSHTVAAAKKAALRDIFGGGRMGIN